MKGFTKKMLSLLVVLLAGFATAWADTVTDVITADKLAATGTSYANFSGLLRTSYAVYAGNSAKTNDAIQLRTNNSNSGIVTTTSGGTVKTVTVEWASNTATGRVLDVYASNTPYTAATELYNAETRGTKVGSIKCGESTSVELDEEYAYVALRSNNNALYLASISIEWEGEARDREEVPAPTLSLPTGYYANSVSVEITAAEGTKVYYTTDGSTPTVGEEGTLAYSEAVTFSVTSGQQKFTLKAIAVDDDGYASSAVSAEYTLTYFEPLVVPAGCVGFDLAMNAWGLPLGSSANANAGDLTAPIVQNGAKLICDNGTASTSCRMWSYNGAAELRAYAGSSLTFAAPAGYAIKSMTFALRSGTLTAAEGTIENNVWTGDAAGSVTVQPKGTINLTSVLLELEKVQTISGLFYIKADGKNIKAANNALACTAFNADAVAKEDVFIITPAAGGTYTIQSYGTGAYISEVTAEGVALAADAASLTLTAVADGYTIACGDAALNAGDGVVAAGDATAWTLEAVPYNVLSILSGAVTPPALGKRLTAADFKDGMYIAIGNVQYAAAQPNAAYPNTMTQGFLTSAGTASGSWWGTGAGVFVLEDGLDQSYIWQVEAAGDKFYLKNLKTGQYIGGELKNVKMVDKAEALPLYATDVTYSSSYYRDAVYFDANNLIRFRTPSNDPDKADFYFGPVYNYGGAALLDGDNGTLFSMVFAVDNAVVEVTPTPTGVTTRGEQLAISEMVDGATFIMNTATKVRDNNSANWYLGTTHVNKHDWSTYYPLSLTEGIDGSKVYQFENAYVISDEDGDLQMMYVKNLATGLYLRGAVDDSSPSGFVTELVSKEEATAFAPFGTVAIFGKKPGEGNYGPTNENSIVLGVVEGQYITGWFSPFWNYGYSYFGTAQDLIGANLYKVNAAYVSALTNYVYKQGKVEEYSKTGFGAYDQAVAAVYLNHLFLTQTQLEAGALDEAAAKARLEELQEEEVAVKATMTGAGYYYIVNNTLEGKSMYYGKYDTTSGLRLLWGPTNSNDLRQIFKIEKASDSKWAISTVVDGQVLGNEDTNFYNLAGTSQEGKPVTIKTQEDGSVMIIPDGGMSFCTDRPGYNAYHVAGGTTNNTWNLVAVDEDVLAQLMTEAKCQLAAAAIDAQICYTVGKNPGNVDAEGAEALTAYNAAVDQALAIIAEPTSTDEEAATAKAAIAAAQEAIAPYVNPVDDAIYNVTNSYFRHAAFGIVDRMTIGSLTYSGLVHKNAADESVDNMAYLWHIFPAAVDDEDGTVYYGFQNMENKKYMTRNGYWIMDLADELAVAGVNAFLPLEGGNFNMINSNGRYVTIETYGNNGYIVAYDSNESTMFRNRWSLQTYGYEVNVSADVKAALPNGDEVYMATVILPQAVKLPAGVAAWNSTVGTGDDHIELSAYEGDVIPANTAVVITASTPGAYIFKLADADASIATAFSGNARKDVAASELTGTAYVLTNTTEGAPVLRPVGDTMADGSAMYIPARKGYVLIPSGSAMLTVRFAGDATGINGVDATADEAAYYDLQGRKVANPVKGQIYIKNGKKVVK